MPKQLDLFDKSKPRKHKPKIVGRTPPTATSDRERRRQWLLALVAIDPALVELTRRGFIRPDDLDAANAALYAAAADEWGDE
jgi:hypothetical protein